MTDEEFNAKLDNLARKRNYAADVLGKMMLALSYQQEIDKLIAERNGKSPHLNQPTNEV